MSRTRSGRSRAAPTSTNREIWRSPSRSSEPGALRCSRHRRWAQRPHLCLLSGEGRPQGKSARAPRRRRRRGCQRGVPARVPQFGCGFHRQPVAGQGDPRPAPPGAWPAHRRAPAGQLPAARERLSEGGRRPASHAARAGALFRARRRAAAALLGGAGARCGRAARAGAAMPAERRRRLHRPAARRHGVDIECNARVVRVAQGMVMLEDERKITARAVVANVNPKLLYLELVDRGSLPPEFVARMQRYKCASASFRMNVALSALPRFACHPEPGPHHASGIIMAPSLAYMDRAYLDARQDGISRSPIVEMVIQSTLDDTLAPRGAHVASLFCQHFAPEVDWSLRKQEAVERIFDVIEAHAPGFRASLIAYSALSPADLERDFGLVGGDIFHGALTLDQLWSARPLLGYADYRAPLDGLYLCGSGAHPGGGVTGAPGHNCARGVRRDLGRRFPG